MAEKLTVVLSRSQSNHPARRELEDGLLSDLRAESEVEVYLIPHLYDLAEDHAAVRFLRSIPGDLAVLAWLYPRATHWTLDRNGVKGRVGETQMESEEEETAETDAPLTGAVDVPARYLFALDLRNAETAEPYLREIRRIGKESRVHQRAQAVVEKLGLKPAERADSSSIGDATDPDELLQPAKRRWYPVIDYGRCTNCMECIDFCLFGVYDVDEMDRILVENPDSCKKGCPACSRVCPDDAIIFPEFRSPAIAGANVEKSEGGEKLDLSELFAGGNPLDLAVDERDRALLKEGLKAVGMDAGIPSRAESKSGDGGKDDLDKLMDALEETEI